MKNKEPKKPTGLCNFYIDPELQGEFNKVCLDRKEPKGKAHVELHEFAIRLWIEKGVKSSITDQLEVKP